MYPYYAQEQDSPELSGRPVGWCLRNIVSDTHEWLGDVLFWGWIDAGEHFKPEALPKSFALLKFYLFQWK